MKATVKVLLSLCEKYFDTHRTLFVDRFYTSIDLIKELYKRNLYVTGIVMSNRLPKEVTQIIKSNMYLQKSRGGHIEYSYTYKDDNNEMKKAGLVIWKDKKPVLCMSTNCNTNEVDTCVRRTANGRVIINRPKLIAEYNKYMGGVDLADQRRLNVNSTIMGSNRWWLKLFFYNIDVATANALVSYNLGMDKNKDPINLFSYKCQLVEVLVGSRVRSINPPIELPHVLARTQNNTRYRCVFCLVNNRDKRTRFDCSSCNMPLCSPGNGKSEEDCFAIAHSTALLHCICRLRFEQMQVKTNNILSVPKKKK